MQRFALPFGLETRLRTSDWAHTAGIDQRLCADKLVLVTPHGSERYIDV